MKLVVLINLPYCKGEKNYPFHITFEYSLYNADIEMIQKHIKQNELD